MELFAFWKNENDHRQGAYVYSFNTNGETVQNPYAPSNNGNRGFNSWSDLTTFTTIRYNRVVEDGTTTVSGVVTASNADGRLEIFGRNANGGVMAAHQTAPNSSWSGWSVLGGTNLVGRMIVASKADGRLEAFVRNGNGGVMAAHQVAPNSSWSGWTDLGGTNLTGTPAVGHNADGRLEVFARNGNGGVMAAHQSAPNSTWSGWTDLGGLIV